MIWGNEHFRSKIFVAYRLVCHVVHVKMLFEHPNEEVLDLELY